MDPLAGRGDPGWFATAVREISQIRVRLSMTSDRAFARAIHMNPRTVAKLNPDHPDATLQYETVDKVFKQVGLLLNEFGDDQSEECLLVFQAQLRVYLAYANEMYKPTSREKRGDGKQQHSGRMD